VPESQEEEMWRWLLVVVLFGCRTVGEHETKEPLDIRCAEDCGSEGATFEQVTHEVAVTGEDSWRCVCRKGPDEIRLW
jgi:hypothetical protein